MEKKKRLSNRFKGLLKMNYSLGVHDPGFTAVLAGVGVPFGDRIDVMPRLDVWTTANRAFEVGSAGADATIDGC